MLKKKHRGVSASQVSELFDGSAQTISSPFFRVNWKGVDQDFPQFVVITNRKFHKSAVRRNRFRRRLYEMIRLQFSDWTRGVRVAILVKNAALKASERQLREEFSALMKRAELFV